jgi:hypothetical protein
LKFGKFTQLSISSPFCKYKVMHAPCALVNIPCTPTDKQNDATPGNLIAADYIQ